MIKLEESVEAIQKDLAVLQSVASHISRSVTDKKENE
jgi:hypothetical protein